MNEKTVEQFHEAVTNDDLKRKNNFDEPAFFSQHFLDFASNLRIIKQIAPRLDGWERNKIISQIKSILDKFDIKAES